MATKVEITAFALVLVYGLWLAFHPEPVTGFNSSWNCAAGKAPICIQKLR
jgi:hypothetical protein